MIKIDTEVLKEQKDRLNREFNGLSNIISDVLSTNNSIRNGSVWSSISSEHYSELYKAVEDNYAILKDKFNNVIDYIDSVINNYDNLNSGAAKSFSDSFKQLGGN